MDISSVSSNTFVQQFGGVQTAKQTLKTDPHEDASVASTQETSQNTGVNAVRTVEQNSESNQGNETGSNNEDTGNTGATLGGLLDVEG